MTENIFWQTIKILALDWVGEILYFPIWWYGPGLKRIFLHTWHRIHALAGNLALKIMLRNLFRPMFGQYDRAGRTISFFMRLLLIISRSVVFIILSIIYLSLLLVWVLLPIFVVWQLFANFIFLWKP